MFVDTGYKPGDYPENAIVVPAEIPKQKAYRVKIFDGETLTNDAVRCLNSDGVEGFFDLATQTFHPTEEGYPWHY